MFMCSDVSALLLSLVHFLGTRSGRRTLCCRSRAPSSRLPTWAQTPSRTPSRPCVSTSTSTWPTPATASTRSCAGGTTPRPS
eukprot:352472-Chlamydomonas_euryale.AAC.1